MFEFDKWKNAIPTTEKMVTAYVALPDKMKMDFLNLREKCEEMLIRLSGEVNGAEKLMSEIWQSKRLGIWHLSATIYSATPIRFIGIQRVLTDPEIVFPDFCPLFQIDISPKPRRNPSETIQVENKNMHITWDEFDFFQKKAKEYSFTSTMLLDFLNKHIECVVQEHVAPLPFYPELISRYRAMAVGCGPSEATLHLLDMLNTLETSAEQSLTKKHRWLGWIQGELIHLGATTVQAERDFTRDIFKGA